MQLSTKKSAKSARSCGALGCPGCPPLDAAVAARIGAYVPKSLPGEVWQRWGPQVRCVVRRTVPGSQAVARATLSTLCAFLASTGTTGEEALAKVLTVEAIGRYLRGLPQRTGANQKARLERLRWTALGLPYRASNDTDAAATRSRVKGPYKLSAYERDVLETLCASAPLVSVVGGEGLGWNRVRPLVQFLPPADVEGAREVLRGSVSGRVWHREPGSAQVLVSEADRGKDHK